MTRIIKLSKKGIFFTIFQKQKIIGLTIKEVYTKLLNAGFNNIGHNNFVYLKTEKGLKELSFFDL